MKRRHPGMCLFLLLAAAAAPAGLLAGEPQNAEPQNGSLRIDAPLVSARVFGQADVSVTLNNLWLWYVQFRVDGQPIANSGVLPPYRITWDTTGVSDGWHTLTAVAYDYYYNEYTSPPIAVRVNNAPPPAAPVTRYEETAVTYGPGWTPRFL